MTNIFKILAAASLCMIASCGMLEPTGYIENGQEYKSKDEARLSQVIYKINNITSTFAHIEFGVFQFRQHTKIKAAAEFYEAKYEETLKDNLLFSLENSSYEFTPDMDFDRYTTLVTHNTNAGADYVAGFVFTFEKDGTEPVDTVFTEVVHFKIPEKEPTISIDVVDITSNSAMIKVGYTDVMYPTLEMKFSNWYYRDMEITEDGDKGEFLIDVDELEPDTEYTFIIYPGFLAGGFEGSFKTLK